MFSEEERKHLVQDKRLGWESRGPCSAPGSLAVGPLSGFSHPNSTAQPWGPGARGLTQGLSYCQLGHILGCDSCSCQGPVCLHLQGPSIPLGAALIPCVYSGGI